jgi:apolipoprotein N-acyltransferase
MESNGKSSWVGTAGRRTLLLVALIAVLVPFWLYLAFYTNLPMLALAGIAVLILLLLSLTMAWAATAMPRRNVGKPEQRNG